MGTIKQRGIQRRSYVEIKDDRGRNSYGGNQGWFSKEEGTLKEKWMSQYGCGVVAITDLFLYWAMTRVEAKESFVSKYIGEHYVILKEDYMKLLEEIRNRYAFIFGKAGTFGFELALGINRYNKDNQLPFVARLNMGFNSVTMLRQIEDSLKMNQPIILMIGKANPNFLRWGDKIGIPFYKQIRNIRSAKISERGAFARYELAKEGVGGHFVTITGMLIDEKANYAHEHIMLRISSWGEEYYISYHHLRTYIHSISSPYLSALITIDEKEVCNGTITFS